MSRSLRVIVLAAVLVITAFGVAGCGDIAAKVEAAENPAPTGTYEGIEVSSHVSINEKANYAWEIDGTTYDAVTNADTEYAIDGESASLSSFDDADENTGVYEGDNEDSLDDTYDIEVGPDGIIASLNLILGK